MPLDREATPAGDLFNIEQQTVDDCRRLAFVKIKAKALETIKTFIVPLHYTSIDAGLTYSYSCPRGSLLVSDIAK